MLHVVRNPPSLRAVSIGQPGEVVLIRLILSTAWRYSFIALFNTIIAWRYFRPHAFTADMPFLILSIVYSS
jgi:hypothetical protein